MSDDTYDAEDLVYLNAAIAKAGPLFIDTDGRVSQPTEKWSDGEWRNPNHHNNWHEILPYFPDRVAELEGLLEARSDLLSRSEALVDDLRKELADARNEFQFFRTSMTCFNDADLLAYRVRQREHGARNASARVRELEAEVAALKRPTPPKYTTTVMTKAEQKRRIRDLLGEGAVSDRGLDWVQYYLNREAAASVSLDKDEREGTYSLDEYLQDPT